MKIKSLIRSIAISILFLTSHNGLADNVIEVAAQPDKGFNFPFLLKIPEETTNNRVRHLIVETNNTADVSDEFEFHLGHARGLISSDAIGPLMSKETGFPILVPVFPRSKTNWQIYTHALDSDTMAVESGDLKRIDLQLLAMIEAAKVELKTRSKPVDEQVLLTGFSASGTFASRFALLHPKSIKLVVAGALNGILMLPVTQVDDTTLNFPLGLADFEPLMGKAFERENWQALPQLLFMGENDSNDTTKFGDAFSDQEKETIYLAMGKEMMPDRWENCQKIYKEQKANVTFRTYSGIGHGTNGKIHKEILNFIDQNL